MTPSLPPRRLSLVAQAAAPVALSLPDGELVARAAQRGGSLPAALAAADRARCGRGGPRAGDVDPLSCTQAARLLSAASDDCSGVPRTRQDFALPPPPAQLRDMHRHGDTLESLRAAEAGDMLSLGGDGGVGESADEVEADLALARGGDPGGHRQMGFRYLTGTGVEPDGAAALRAFSRGCCRGRPAGRIQPRLYADEGPRWRRGGHRRGAHPV